MADRRGTDDDNYRSPIKKRMQRDKRDAKEKKRDRVLSDDEIRVFWQATGEMPTVFGGFARLLLLTAQRLEKVRSLRWEHLSDHDSVWNIETDRREKGNAGRLELPPLAKDVLAKARQHRSYDGGYVFPGRHGQIYNNVAGGKLVLEKTMDGELFGIAPWTLHDLRRTARTLMERAGVRGDIAEQVLGHQLGGVLGIYNRYTYDAEKAQALLTLEKMIRSIIDPAPATNVVHLERASLKAEAV